jgi:quercetin dioxygenase-like cupin family protein
MTLHVLTGGLAFRAAGDDYRMAEGNVLFFGPGDAHDIRATEDTALLLTISVIGDDFGAEPGAQR